MDERLKGSTSFTAREWTFSILLLIGAITIIYNLATIEQLRKTIATQKTQAEQLHSQIDRLENTSTHLFAQAAEAQHGKQHDNALSQYKQIVEKFPTSAEAVEAQKRITLIQAELARQNAAAKAAALRQKALAEAEAKRIQAEEAAKRRAYEESIKPPLKLVGARVTFNCIGNPEAGVLVRNVSRKTVDAYTIRIYCYDRFGDPINYLNESNYQGGISQDTLRPGRSSGYDTWTLYGRETTAKIRVELRKVHMTDGTEWEPQANQQVAVWGYSKK